MDQQQALDTIRRCCDPGVNDFDTAARTYGVSRKRYGIAPADVRDKIYCTVRFPG